MNNSHVEIRLIERMSLDEFPPRPLMACVVFDTNAFISAVITPPDVAARRTTMSAQKIFFSVIAAGVVLAAVGVGGYFIWDGQRRDDCARERSFERQYGRISSDPGYYITKSSCSFLNR